MTPSVHVEDADDEASGSETESGGPLPNSQPNLLVANASGNPSSTSPSSSTSKNVRFNISDSSPSTPDSEKVGPDFSSSTPHKSSSDASISKSFSNSSLTDQSTATVYRNFVNKALRKMGLSKAHVRLRSILQSTLRRARHALSRHRPNTVYQPARPFEVRALHNSMEIFFFSFSFSLSIEFIQQPLQFLSSVAFGCANILLCRSSQACL